MAYHAVFKQLQDLRTVQTSTKTTVLADGHSVEVYKRQIENLNQEIEYLKKSATATSNNSSQISQLTLDYENKLRTANNRIQEVELQLKTANSRIADLEAQLRTAKVQLVELESQLKQAKSVRSSAVTEGQQLVDSKYSSSSSSNMQVTSSNVQAARSTYEPSYQSSSQVSGLSGSGIKQATSYIQSSGTTGNTYTTGGTAAYQSSSGTRQLTSSGLQGTTENTYGTGALMTGGAPLASGSGSGAYRSITGSSATQSYTSSTTGPTYGTTVTNTTSGQGSTTYSATMSGSGMRSSGTNLSGYTFQTKKL